METKQCPTCKITKSIDDFPLVKGKYYCYCRPCRRAKNTAYREANREKLAKAQRERYQNFTPEEKEREHRLKVASRYKISVDEYEALLQEHADVCAICKRSEQASNKERLSVDHDHKTGKVRGLLCARCNLFLGWIDETPEILPGFLAYIEKVRRIT